VSYSRSSVAVLAILLLPTARLFAQGVVFIADGSGGLPGPGPEIARQISGACVLTRVEMVDWSHGWGRVFLDLYHHGHHETQGQELACRIMTYRQACPSGRIYLVGHSSGAAVILAATEHLPPGSVTRVILLAPSVATTYDLRSALRAACEGVDAFYSHRDLVSLSMTVAGTADHQYFVGAAGYHGFRTLCGDEAALYSNLRQYPGCYSGHFSCTQAAFVRDHVLPLLVSPAIAGSADGPAASAAPGSDIRSAGYQSAAALQRLVDELLADDDFVYTPPVRQGPAPGPGRGGIAPISDSLRLP
jgi:pimeloyl-ACP methyl ester carboxylesterase